jgi:pimeloyl-ACP methyl ester carboxylesterase
MTATAAAAGAAPRISTFTSEKARARFVSKYERALERCWPPDRQSLDIATSFGPTRAHRVGPPDGVPFVLLPGAGGNALMWHPHVAALAAPTNAATAPTTARPVIAIDPVGEPGGSVQTAPITGGPDAARWLGEVLTALQVERAHLVGCSFGGWTAIQHELHAPGRAATLTLLDPAGFGRITGRFLRWIILGGLAGFTPRPVRHRAARWLRNETLRDDELMALVRSAFTFRRRLPVPDLFSDDDLRRVDVPALVLLGEHSSAYDVAQVADRIRRVMPTAHADIIAGASHDVALYRPELLVERITAFAARADSAA